MGQKNTLPRWFFGAFASQSRREYMENPGTGLVAITLPAPGFVSVVGLAAVRFPGHRTDGAPGFPSGSIPLSFFLFGQFFIGNKFFHIFTSQIKFSCEKSLPATDIIYSTQKNGGIAMADIFPVIDMVATGENITRLRKARGLTVRDLQNWFGFEEPQAIYKWQNGKSLPSVDNLYALGILLGVPMEAILVLYGAERNTADSGQQEISCCPPYFAKNQLNWWQPLKTLF